MNTAHYAWFTSDVTVKVEPSKVAGVTTIVLDRGQGDRLTVSLNDDQVSDLITHLRFQQVTR